MKIRKTLTAVLTMFVMTVLTLSLCLVVPYTSYAGVSGDDSNTREVPDSPPTKQQGNGGILQQQIVLPNPDPASWVVGFARVLPKDASVRDAAGKIIATMHKGEIVPVLDWNAGNGKVKVSVNGVVAYMDAKDLSGNPADETPLSVKATVTRDNAAIFDKPSYDATPLLYLTKGASFSVDKVQNGWAHGTGNGVTGWMDEAGLNGAFNNVLG